MTLTYKTLSAALKGHVQMKLNWLQRSLIAYRKFKINTGNEKLRLKIAHPATFGERFGAPIASVSITELVQEKFCKTAV